MPLRQKAKGDLHIIPNGLADDLIGRRQKGGLLKDRLNDEANALTALDHIMAQRGGGMHQQTLRRAKMLDDAQFQREIVGIRLINDQRLVQQAFE